MIYRRFEEHGNRYLDTSEIKNKQLNITYSNADPRCKLDIYYPETTKKKKAFSTIIFFHGGAFLKGDKQRYQLFSALQGIFNGFAVVSVNYRLLPKFNHTDYLEDAKNAVDFIVNNSEEYKIDKGDIYLWGESAGAFLSLVVGLTSSDHRLEEYLSIPHKKTHQIKGIVSWYAPTDLITHPDTIVLDGQSLNFLKYGKSGQALEKIFRKLSPINLLNQKSPNLYIQHGTDDDIVSPMQAIKLAQVSSHFLTKSQICLDLLVGANHTTEEFSKKENLSKIFNQLHIWKKR